MYPVSTGEQVTHDPIDAVATGFGRRETLSIADTIEVPLQRRVGKSVLLSS
jgi:hypothetical protein